ncbi:MAG: hypothetical protein OHK93_001502 [Ramalina farinacea]|uniref:Clavaminate synthase-like protein n=1 Tax=Ramalina farinacea TaxID=258253 RepID=A0AA43QPQ1_9LECA|nr:hypothetical protein [Ramalina farinacea]
MQNDGVVKTGHYDTLKGSYYVNCAFYNGQDLSKQAHPLSEQFPEFTAPNLWPDEGSLPGFKSAFEELCTVIIDTAIVVAGLVDKYAEANIKGYERGYLEHVVKSSILTKARLLHYFPPKPSDDRDGYNCPDTSPRTEDASPDSWCATHIDHGCLTGLTAPMYVDESQERLTSHTTGDMSPLRCLAQPPDASTGLYIQARDSTIVKVSIPPDCLAFQTGEALQVITGGQFKAVPHFVKAGAKNRLGGTAVARNTLAVFTQPNLEDIVDPKKGTTFGEFSKHVMERFA